MKWLKFLYFTALNPSTRSKGTLHSDSDSMNDVIQYPTTSSTIF